MRRSNMPSARQICRALLDYCAPPEEVETLFALPSLRYEMVVEYIKENFDSDSQILGLSGLAIYPNIIHYFIAQMILKQNFVVTTNFDYLL